MEILKDQQIVWFDNQTCLSVLLLSTSLLFIFRYTVVKMLIVNELIAKETKIEPNL